MAKELFKEKINGKSYKATKAEEDGREVILVEVNGDTHRYSPDYSVEELKFALSNEIHNQQKYEARNG